VHRATLPSGLREIGFISGTQTGIAPPQLRQPRLWNIAEPIVKQA